MKFLKYGHWFTIMICLLIITLRIFVFTNVRVDGASMEPTLHDGDVLLLNTLQYNFSEPDYGDIVVFQSEYKEQKLIKRIVGKPHDYIQVIDHHIYVNGAIVDESYIMEPMRDKGNINYPIELSDNEYFVVGDNRNDSLDSRFYQIGNIYMDDILGKAVFQLYPFNKIGAIGR